MATIKTTLGALVNAEQYLGKALATKFDKPGGEKVRYHCVKLARLVSAETKHFHDERNDFINEHGTGDPPRLDTESPQWGEFLAFNKKLSEVAVEIAWGPLTEAMLNAYADLTGETWFGLGPLFVLDEEVAEVTK